MKINKNEHDAIDFAETLTDKGEEEIFWAAWTTHNYNMIQGHFPAFGLTLENEVIVSGSVHVEKDGEVIPKHVAVAANTNKPITDLHAIMGDVPPKPTAKVSKKK